MIRDAISKAVQGKDLTIEQSSAAMKEIMEGRVAPSQVGSFATAMRMKGETEEELYGFASVMRERSVKINCPPGAVDLCGTGGDGTGTFNISTAASFAICSAGIPVAKHGNRSISSSSGSADVLAALGIAFDLSSSSVERCLAQTGMGFMFAPTFHDSMKHVMDARKEIGIRTFFNLLGPLVNPGEVKIQLMGVYDPALAPMMARVLRRLGSRRVMVVHGSGMDEITLTGETNVVEMTDGDIQEYIISPEDFGLELASIEELKGGSPQDNARIMLSVLQGEDSPRSDIVALNAGAALYVGGKAGSITEGIKMARRTLESGSAFSKIRQFSEKCLRLEEEEQLAMSACKLVDRRITLKALIERCGNLSNSLLERIHERDLGSYLDSIDKDLLEAPNTLSYILLRRILDIPSISIPEDKKIGSDVVLSQIISDSQGVSVIGEYKPTSPSTPLLTVPPLPELAIAAYQKGGVVGLSVLVEPQLFGGDPQLFSAMRSITDLPMLYKDFVISMAQIDLAHSVGADAVLLIASALEESYLDEMIHECLVRGMEPLIEVHSVEDIEKMRGVANYDLVDLIGVNSRNLRTMEVRIQNLGSIRPMIDSGKVRIAESGVRSLVDLDRLKGYDGALIGSMFMSSPDITRSAGEVVSRCREVCA